MTFNPYQQRRGPPRRSRLPLVLLLVLVGGALLFWGGSAALGTARDAPALRGGPPAAAEPAPAPAVEAPAPAPAPVVAPPPPAAPVPPPPPVVPEPAPVPPPADPVPVPVPVPAPTAERPVPPPVAEPPAPEPPAPEPPAPEPTPEPTPEPSPEPPKDDPSEHARSLAVPIEALQPALWLRGDVGVELAADGSSVGVWRDPVSGAEAVPAEGRSGPLVVPDALGGRDALRFPCAMRVPGRRLRDQHTVIAVLRPEHLERGNHVDGQQFMGHYPLGQLRFHDYTLAYKSLGRDLEYSGVELAEGEFHMAVYKFDGGVELRLDDLRPKTPRAPSRGVTVEFSNTPLFVGGVGHTEKPCGFRGDIAEVLVFDRVLDDIETGVVTAYLREAWFGGRFPLEGPPLSPAEIAAKKRDAALRGESTRPPDPHKPPAGPTLPPATVLDPAPAPAPAEPALPPHAAPAPVPAAPPAPAGQRTCTFTARVDTWQPPESADFELKLQWKTAVDDLLRNARSTMVGGAPLKEWLRKEVNTLDVLRHRLFSKIPGCETAE